MKFVEDIKKAYKATPKVWSNVVELINAVSMTAVTAFSGYQAHAHLGQGYEWVLLGAAAAWIALQAVDAWLKVLNK